MVGRIIQPLALGLVGGLGREERGEEGREGGEDILIYYLKLVRLYHHLSTCTVFKKYETVLRFYQEQ